MDLDLDPNLIFDGSKIGSLPALFEIEVVGYSNDCNDAYRLLIL